MLMKYYSLAKEHRNTGWFLHPLTGNLHKVSPDDLGKFHPSIRWVVILNKETYDDFVNSYIHTSLFILLYLQRNEYVKNYYWKSGY